MKKTVYEYTTRTTPDALLASLEKRVEEYDAMQGDRRALISLRESDAENATFTLLVREGATPAGNLDLKVTLSPDGSGGAAIRGTLAHDPADGEPTFGTRLYGLFLSGFARLTVLLLFYGILLGVAYAFPGRNFLLPAIPPAVVLVLMVFRSVLVRRRLPKRIDRFFVDFCGATPSEPRSPVA